MAVLILRSCGFCVLMLNCRNDKGQPNIISTNTCYVYHHHHHYHHLHLPIPDMLLSNCQTKRGNDRSHSTFVQCFSVFYGTVLKRRKGNQLRETSSSKLAHRSKCKLAGADKTQAIITYLWIDAFWSGALFCVRRSP